MKGVEQQRLQGCKRQLRIDLSRWYRRQRRRIWREQSGRRFTFMTCLYIQVMRADFQFEDEDRGSLLPTFPKAFKKIREGLQDDGAVLIFCETGQASTALMAAFLMADKVPFT
jgi:hypothetical protein